LPRLFAFDPRLAAVMPAEHRACQGTGVHSHRDARRIGPIRIRGTLDRIVSQCSGYPSGTALRPCRSAT
jgi:hypothetical protein